MKRLSLVLFTVVSSTGAFCAGAGIEVAAPGGRIVFSEKDGSVEGVGYHHPLYEMSRGAFLKVAEAGDRPCPSVHALSTLEVYGDLSRVNALSIGGARTLDDVTRDSFAALAREAHMRPQLVLGRLDSMSAEIIPAADALASDMGKDCPSPVYGKIEGRTIGDFIGS